MMMHVSTQEIEGARRQDISNMRVPPGGIIVDPAEISMLLQPVSKRGKKQTAAPQRSQQVPHEVTSTCGSSFSAAKGVKGCAKAGSVSEASDTTGEPDCVDSSESDSGSGGGSSANGSDRFEAPALPVNMPQTRKGNMSWRLGAKNKINARSQENPRGANVLRSREQANSSPEAFAAAWNAASTAGVWKKESAQQLQNVGSQSRPQKQKTAKDVPAQRKNAQELRKDEVPNMKAESQDDDSTEAIPMPKWFTPGCEKFAKPLPVGAINLGNQDTSPMPLSIRCDQPLKDTSLMPIPGCCDLPLKISMPYFECEKPCLDPQYPCKKRVPDWDM
jgi:hypothetical protein